MKGRETARPSRRCLETRLRLLLLLASFSFLSGSVLGSAHQQVAILVAEPCLTANDGEEAGLVSFCRRSHSRQTSSTCDWSAGVV